MERRVKECEQSLNFFFALNRYTCTDHVRLSSRQLEYLVREIWGEDKTTISTGVGCQKNRHQPAPHPSTNSSFVVAQVDRT